MKKKETCPRSPHNGINCGAYIIRLGKITQAVKNKFQNVPENLAELVKNKIEPILKNSKSPGCWSGKIRGISDNDKEIEALFQGINKDLKQT